MEKVLRRGKAKEGTKERDYGKMAVQGVVICSLVLWVHRWKMRTPWAPMECWQREKETWGRQQMLLWLVRIAGDLQLDAGETDADERENADEKEVQKTEDGL